MGDRLTFGEGIAAEVLVKKEMFRLGFRMVQELHVYYVNSIMGI